MKILNFNLALLLTAMLLIPFTGRGENPAAPDFAFPDKVEKTASADLKAALRDGDGKAVVNAVIRLGLAKSIVNQDSLPDVLARISALSASEKDPATAALLNSLSATIYTQVYSADSWQYNNRETVGLVPAADYTLWSRRQFMERVDSLVTASLKDADALRLLPLSGYKGVVDCDDAGYRFYPTLYDFIAVNGINSLNTFAQSYGGLDVLNVKLVGNPENATLYPGATCAPLASILRVYDGLLEFHRQDTAPRFLQMINVRSFINSHLYNADSQAFYARRQPATTVMTPYILEMRRLYESNEGNEFSGMFLTEVSQAYQPGSSATEICALLSDFKSKYPAYFNIGKIDNEIARLTQPSASISAPSAASPGKPFKVKVNSVNARKVKIDFYNLSGLKGVDLSGEYLGRVALPAPMKTLEVDFQEQVPFGAEREIEMTFPEYGVYTWRLSVDGTHQAGGYRLMRCTDISSAVTSSANESSAWVVDATTGAPVEGALLYFKPWSGKQGFTRLPGTTGKIGSMQVDVTEYGQLSARKGKDIYSVPEGFWRWRNSGREEELRVDFQTALKLYRPGDELQFSLVAFVNQPRTRVIAAERRIAVELRDANYQPVDTLVLTTDLWGRAEGSFTLPSSGLTGNYQLRAGEAQGVRTSFSNGQTSVQVSDYKLPTFVVEKTAVGRPASLTQPATVDGVATTYSGFPVAEAKVKASLSVMSGFWWWATTSPVFYTCETVTDAAGKFRVEIPASAIASSPNPAGLFKCQVEVTSPDGETRTMEATFNMGKPYMLSVSLPQLINLDAPFKAMVEARDMNDQTLQTDVSYKISDDSVLVASGTVPTGSFADAVKALSPGRYQIEFAPVDTALAEAAAPQEFIVYSPKSKICPVKAPLWVPVRSVTADKDGMAEILFGSDTEGAYVRMLVSEYPGKIVEKKWLRTEGGMQTVRVKLPAGAESVRVDFSCVKDFRSYSEDVTVMSAASDKRIKVEVVTFRDKVTPLQTEKVTLRVIPEGGTSARSAVMLDMSNKAIDALAANPLSMSVFAPAGWNINTNGWSFGDASASMSVDFKYKKTARIENPEFELYGLSFNGRSTLFTYSRKYAKSLRIRGTHPVAKEESADEAEMVNNLSVAAPAFAAGATADAGADNLGVVREDSEEVIAEEKGAGSEDTAGKEENYRPSEIPLAFFRPMLTTAEDGTLEITYEVPDANTTWLLRALAYNRELLTGSASVEIVASKPVMVSPNAPRFLRTGDNVRLAASVMNNTDSLLTVSVVPEILSSADGKVMASSAKEYTLGPKSSEIATVDVTAPAEAPGLIYRVRATAGDFTDGEQSLLPVLPSEQDVVESRIFYIAPDESRFTLDLPAMKEGDRAYLNFTENPAWQVVSALPGLRENKINASTEAASALFSACVAEGLMKENPEVARVLRRWLDNPGDSALVSSLEKNQELKSMLLSATPWVSEALSDTERMQRLALLFDRRQTRRVIESSIDLLAQTRAEGGWCWTASYPYPSQWCTEIIMEQLGDLNRMGWLPSDSRLKNMIEETCRYLDSQAVKAFKENPRGDYWLYVSLRDAFPKVKLSSAAARVTEAQIQKCVAGWKEQDVPMKAVYALILNAHGYHATAGQILESLRQYATSTPEKGMWWQQLDRYNFRGLGRIGMTSIILDAFQAVEPGCADVDRIRQWLILNKTNNDWGSAVITSQVITSILTSGKPLQVNTRGTAIRIGDTLLEPSSQEYATGAFTEQITSLLKSPETMTIDRQADYPSVGGVVTMRRLPMDDVRAVSCSEISVEKSLNVFDGVRWIPAKEFKVGDRVMVELVLKVEDDLSYLVIEDLRAAGLEPAAQLPAPIIAEGLYFYRENRDSQTNIFIDRLPRGTYRLSYELFASQAGEFASGAARAQSQYNPIVAAHSGGMIITVK